jgi:hypothetical protein
MAKVDDIFSALDCGSKPQKIKASAKPIKPESKRKADESKLYMDGISYMALLRSAKETSERVQELRDSLLVRAEEDGVDIDDKHKEVKIGNVNVVVTYREGSSFNDEVAEKILKKKQLYDKAVVTVIDPEKVMELYRQKLLSKEDIEKFVTLKRTPSLSVTMDAEKPHAR